MRAIGTDIIEIERVARLLRQERFLMRVFTRYEQHYLRSRGTHAAQSAAGFFCAKEAVAKALGSGIGQGLSFLDIKITHTPSGAPQVAVAGRERLQISLSISHCRAYATATALIWED